jgi:hypothetical protein
VKNIQILTLSVCAVQGCVLETDADKSVSIAQIATVDAMKSVRVQTIGKVSLLFFWNIEEMLCPFTLTTMLGKTYLYRHFRKALSL